MDKAAVKMYATQNNLILFKAILKLCRIIKKGRRSSLQIFTKFNNKY
jgi:hypothetical protein